MPLTFFEEKKYTREKNIFFACDWNGTQAQKMNYKQFFFRT